MALLVFQCIAKCYLRLTEIFYFKLSAELEVKKFVGRTNIIGFFPCLVYSDCSGSFVRHARWPFINISWIDLK